MTHEKIIKKELAEALHVHILLLKRIETVESDSSDALRFVIRSLGFMLERIPEALVSDDEEDLYFAAFQYYNLLAELKNNMAISFPHVTSIDLSAFPDSHVDLLNEWWEEKTGLKVDTPTKQTMTVHKE
ncbi:hypothetical protein DOK76_05925 [Vagococcus sp. DIV0080]|uniref:Uncharacterized protein n=1 Tax=Candidatus Vagococcus giribetii TaxID=2230876 RepID=A0ABS3HTD1_9ENTE|nr:hypothetical protein [Vagococcus sp. DIV0080]MBO0476600.1 hypothetical protein [Vagococcus sp. DIV0080]